MNDPRQNTQPLAEQTTTEENKKPQLKYNSAIETQQAINENVVLASSNAAIATVNILAINCRLLLEIRELLLLAKYNMNELDFQRIE